MAENMASLIDGYCSLINKSNDSIWEMNPNEQTETNVIDRNSQIESDYIESNDKEKVSFDTITKTNSYISMKNCGAQYGSTQFLNDEEEQKSTSNSSLLDIYDSWSDLKMTICKNKCREISPESLVFQEKLGSGQFGEVFKGIFKKSQSKMVEVAIKKLKIIDTDDPAERTLIAKKFMKEAKIMENFDHQHIIKLIGICYEDSLSIVMELAKFGQLRNYLQSNKDFIDTYTLIVYCYQLNSAMAFLESLKFVHRDIAARNVLVFNHECVKLADFGLSREIDENAYLSSKSKLPIKWMAPESINFRRFSSQSDVWMFGICCWEILSYGIKPFQGIKNPDVIRLIEEKKRLEKPENCPDELYALLLNCWEYDSSKRPTFAQLKEKLYIINNNFKDNKSTRKSASNGSSINSNNSSLSSSLSAATNLINFDSKSNTLTKFQLTKSLSSNSRENKSSSPPPKPNRLNNSSDFLRLNSEFSPTRENKIRSLDSPNYRLNAIILNRNSSGKMVLKDENGDDDDDENIDKYSLNRQRGRKLLNDFQNSTSWTQNQTISPKSPSLNRNDFSPHYRSDSKNDRSLSNNANNNWLDNKLKEMVIDKNISNYKKDEYLASKLNASPNYNTISKNRAFSPDKKDKDLLLRDQTLKFIQTISIFIKYLNSEENRQLDNELQSIMISLKLLIQTIESIELYNQCKEINDYINKLDVCLNLMIKELKQNNIEKVINSSLDMARTANDLFITITRSHV